jgi:hypothetical protein
MGDAADETQSSGDRRGGSMTTESQQKAGELIRAALGFRLSQALKIEYNSLPPLSIAEILSLLFGLYGQTNSLGSFGETSNAIRALVGDEIFWCKPKVKPNETISPMVQ